MAFFLAPRDRTRAGKIEIAPDKLRAHGGSGFQGGRPAAGHTASGHTSAGYTAAGDTASGYAAAGHRNESTPAEFIFEKGYDAWVESREHHGYGNGFQTGRSETGRSETGRSESGRVESGRVEIVPPAAHSSRCPVGRVTSRIRFRLHGLAYVQHMAYRRDAADGFHRKQPEAVRQSADKFTVDIDRAAAHARDDAGIVDIGTRDPHHDDIVIRVELVPDDTDHFDFEGIDPGILKDREAVSAHARLHVVDIHEHGMFARGPGFGRRGGLATGRQGG